MVMAEAMACGCPVIASVNTGAADLFSYGREGFIVPVRDSGAICDCLTRLADEPDLRDRMSAAAIERVTSVGGWSSYGDAYADLLRGMAADGRCGGGMTSPSESRSRPELTETDQRRQA